MKKLKNVNQLSFGADIEGVILLSRDSKRVFRAIYNCSQEFYMEKEKCGLIQELVDKKLLQDRIITEYYTDEFNLILEHPLINNIILPCYWSFSMIKQAAIHLLHVNQIANKYGYQLIDAHPWNIAFKNNEPIFLDYGSIQKYTKEIADGFCMEFKRGFLATLLLLNIRDRYFGRKIFETCENFYNITLPGIFIENTPTFNNALNIFTEYHKKNNSLNVLQIIDNVFNKNIFEPEAIDSLFYFPYDNSPWNNYQKVFYDNLLAKNTNDKQYIRFIKIIELIKKLTNVKTATDLAGNSGGFLHLLSQKISMKSYISLDYDENAVEFFYQICNKIKSPISCYLANVLNSTHPISQLAFKSDIVFALALTHHLLLVQNYKIDTIFRIFKNYTNKYICVEFMPLGIWDENTNYISVPDWYNEQWFEKRFKTYFKLLHKEQLEKNRILFIGEIHKGFRCLKQ